jgi:ROK family protein
MYIAIDIGGTKTLLALFSNRGRLLKRRKIKSYQDQVKWLAELNRHLPHILPFRTKSIHAITISYPGILENGHPKKAPNLPDWNGPEIESALRILFDFKKITCPIYYKNDADLGAIFECSQYSKTTLYLTFGTGIGGSIVKNGRLTPESATFEPGHLLKTYKKTRTEWEKIASSKAIRLANHDLDVVKIKSKLALDDIACRMEIGLTDLIKTYRPNQIVISGPIVAVFSGFHDTLKKLLSVSLGSKIEVPPIYPAKKPQESVIYGGYLYGKSKNP